MITNARFTVVNVQDQAKMLQFFEETLGFEVMTNAPYGENSRWIEVRPPGAETYLVIAPADPDVHAVIREKLGPMSNIWFACDDLDMTFAQLKDKGVTFPVEPSPAPWDPSGNTRWAQFSDPEGNLYGLSRRETPDDIQG